MTAWVEERHLVRIKSTYSTRRVVHGRRRFIEEVIVADLVADHRVVMTIHLLANRRHRHTEGVVDVVECKRTRDLGGFHLEGKVLVQAIGTSEFVLVNVEQIRGRSLITVSYIANLS